MEGLELDWWRVWSQALPSTGCQTFICLVFSFLRFIFDVKCKANILTDKNKSIDVRGLLWGWNEVACVHSSWHLVSAQEMTGVTATYHTVLVSPETGLTLHTNPTEQHGPNNWCQVSFRWKEESELRLGKGEWDQISVHCVRKNQEADTRRPCPWEWIKLMPEVEAQPPTMGWPIKGSKSKAAEAPSQFSHVLISTQNHLVIKTKQNKQQTCYTSHSSLN